MLREQFEDILAEFGTAVGQELTLIDDAVNWMVDDEVLVNLHYLDASDSLLLWTQVGPLNEDEDTPPCGSRAMALLRMNDLDGEAAGFTLSVDAANALVLAHDRRSALAISSADALAEWTEALLRCVRAARKVLGGETSTEDATCQVYV